jgi:dTDP-L-rhamnose 4-epimerase
MNKRILITGGAGFVGSHLADELLEHGYEVRALDSLLAQVHGAHAKRPDYLAPEVEFMVGDLRDPRDVWRALDGVDAVFHFAATVGVGQSMYEIAQYTGANGLGTAVLLEALAKRSVERLVVASSMSIYGEGLYQDLAGATVDGVERTLDQLKRRDWEVRGANGQSLIPIPTPEAKRPALPSVYAISKYHQERLCMVVGQAYGISTVALRFFNIFGTRQALSNPYTGVLAIFAARFLNDRAPLINEDGNQKRDFVSVLDIVQACRLSLEVPGAAGHVLNVGSGRAHSIREVAKKMARTLGKECIEPEVTGRYRMGDIRNCFADISLARKILGYEPRVSLEEGLLHLAAWLESQTAVDRVADARRELVSRGLSV